MRAKVKVDNGELKILYDETMYINSTIDYLKSLKHITDYFYGQPLTMSVVKRIELEVNALLSMAISQGYIYTDNLIPSSMIEGLVILPKYWNFEEEFGKNSYIEDSKIEEENENIYSLDNSLKIRERLERI